jgi:hypothetical protein
LRRLLTDVGNELRDRGALDEEECFIDATFVMAKGGGAEIGATKRGKGIPASSSSSNDFEIGSRDRDEPTQSAHCLRLRARRKRSSSDCAAEERDEVAPSQLIELHSVPRQPGRIAGYRIGEEQPAGVGQPCNVAEFSRMSGILPVKRNGDAAVSF